MRAISRHPVLGLMGTFTWPFVQYLDSSTIGQEAKDGGTELVTRMDSLTTFWLGTCRGRKAGQNWILRGAQIIRRAPQAQRLWIYG